MYNPIFEQENRDKELGELRNAIKLRASSDQVRDLCFQFSNFIKSHPIFTSLALGVFSYSFAKK